MNMRTRLAAILTHAAEYHVGLNSRLALPLLWWADRLDPVNNHDGLEAFSGTLMDGLEDEPPYPLNTR